MKGIIFNLLEDVIESKYDEAAWDELIEGAEVSGIYTSLGNYPHGEFITLLDEFAQNHDTNRTDLLRWFGRNAIPMLAERYPGFFTAHDRLKPFLFSLNDVIHSEVRKLYPGADAPMFDFEEPLQASGEAGLQIGYRSQRKLCKLAEGFILGAADYYNETVDIQQPTCMLDGHGECSIMCTFSA